jgi:hypothetical protein
MLLGTLARCACSKPGLEADTKHSGDSAGEEVAFGFERSHPGRVLEYLNQSIGSIPRVLLPDTAGSDDAGVAVIRPSPEEMPEPAERGDRYPLYGETARGAMGAVLTGRDPDLGRDLAIKVLLEKHQDKPKMVRRFVEEAQIGGSATRKQALAPRGCLTPLM